MKRLFTNGLLAAALACAGARPGLARGLEVPAPGGSGAVVSVETVPPSPDSDDLFPSQRLRLSTPGHPHGWVLVDGLRTLCGTDFRWLGPGTLWIRLSEAYERGLHCYDGEVLGGVLLRLDLDTDGVLRRSVSPDGRWSLVELRDCVSENWSLCLRRAGQPDYTSATGSGWEDPTLFGGLQEPFPLLDLEWTGPDSVCAVVALHPFGARFRSRVGPIHLEVEYDEHYRRPPLAFTVKIPPVPWWKRWEKDFFRYF